MLAFMLYATIIGVLFAGAAAVAELMPVLARRRRVLWLVAIAGTIATSSAAVMSEGRETGVGSRVTGVTSPLSNVAAVSTVHETRQDAPASPPPAVADAARANGALGVDAGLLLLWILGSAACMALLGASAWRVARMRRSWREQVIAGVPVLVSHDVGPAVIGLVHHEIVVPAWVETLDEPAQRTIMTHEREHLRAGDPLLLWSATLLVSLMPWNAPLWFALRRLRHAIEMDCDARVLQARVDPRAYCTLLLDVVERTLSGVAPIAALAEPSTMIERRIHAMTSTARTASWKVYVAGTVAASLVIGACYAPRPELAPRARAHELIGELASLMRNDSVASSITPAERETLASAARAKPPAIDESGSGSGSLEHGSAVPALTPQPEKVLAQYYPGLAQRTDTTPAVVALVYDARGNLKAHDLRRITDPHYSSGTRIEHSSLLLRHDLNATVLVAIEAKNQPSRVYPADFPDVSSVRLTHLSQDAMDRVTDSIVAKDYPEAATLSSGALVIAVIFSPDGRVVEKFAKEVSYDVLFQPTTSKYPHVRGTLSAQSILGLAAPHPVGALQTVGWRSLEQAPRVVAIFGVTMGPQPAPPAPSTERSPFEGLGMRLDSIARVRYPEAYRPMEDGMVIGVIFARDLTVQSVFAKHVALGAAFQPRPGYPGELQAVINDARALLSLASDGKLPPLLMAGSQVMRAAPHAILAMGVAER